MSSGCGNIKAGAGKEGNTNKGKEQGRGECETEEEKGSDPQAASLKLWGRQKDKQTNRKSMKGIREKE